MGLIVPKLYSWLFLIHYNLSVTPKIVFIVILVFIMLLAQSTLLPSQATLVLTFLTSLELALYFNQLFFDLKCVNVWKTCLWKQIDIFRDIRKDYLFLLFWSFMSHTQKNFINSVTRKKCFWIQYWYIYLNSIMISIISYNLRILFAWSCYMLRASFCISQ